MCIFILVRFLLNSFRLTLFVPVTLRNHGSHYTNAFSELKSHWCMDTSHNPFYAWHTCATPYTPSSSKVLEKAQEWLAVSLFLRMSCSSWIHAGPCVTFNPLFILTPDTTAQKELRSKRVGVHFPHLVAGRGSL